MAGIVPQPDHRLGRAIFVPEYTYAGCVQCEKSPGGGFESKPTGSEHSQKMPARKNQNIASDRANAIHNLICPRGNMVRRFSAGAAVVEQMPFRALRVNFRRAEAFVPAVVPFDQVAVNFGARAEAGKFARAS